jgi:hypothetical protein
VQARPALLNPRGYIGEHSNVFMKDNPPSRFSAAHDVATS